MQFQNNEKLPSNKVGIALVVVVLVVSGVIFFEKVNFNKDKTVPLENIEIVLERKTDQILKDEDVDQDGLPLWLEEFYKTDSNNPDTDGDGTSDGEEISLKRDPTIKGPEDPLRTFRDMLQTEVDLSDFKPGTLTESVSIDLFQKYLTLKKDGLLTPEQEEQMLQEVTQKAVDQSSLQKKYQLSDLSIVDSNAESIEAYGEQYAQIALSIFGQIESQKNIRDDIQYLKKVSEIYADYGNQILLMSVPSVFDDVHLELLQIIYDTSIFFEKVSQGDDDPVSALVVSAQYRNSDLSEGELYTTLANYFKNNAIIFDTESTQNFWKQFEN